MLPEVPDDEIVATYKYGNTVIYVHDYYYKDKTEEEIQEIIDTFGRIAYKYLQERSRK